MELAPDHPSFASAKVLKVRRHLLHKQPMVCSALLVGHPWTVRPQDQPRWRVVAILTTQVRDCIIGGLEEILPVGDVLGSVVGPACTPTLAIKLQGMQDAVAMFPPVALWVLGYEKGREVGRLKLGQLLAMPLDRLGPGSVPAVPGPRLWEPLRTSWSVDGVKTHAHHPLHGGSPRRGHHKDGRMRHLDGSGG